MCTDIELSAFGQMNAVFNSFYLLNLKCHFSLRKSGK